MKIQEAIKILQKELKKDEGYFYGWQANIAVAFQDVYHNAKDKKDIHKISNDAAIRFLKLLISE